MKTQKDPLKGLNKSQLKAVTHKAGALLIIAGAGTGKTTVLTQRISWLIEKGLAKPEEILALTFTDKAAAEMEERVDRLLPYGSLDLWISTFHSFGQRILENHALDIGLPVNFKLLNNTGLWILIKENFEKFGLDYYRPLGNPSRFIHALISHFSRAKDELISPEDYQKYAKELQLNLDRERKSADSEEAQNASRVAEVAQAYAIYQKILADNNALDFGDLITYTFELFRKRKHLLERYRKKFKCILVDEFQDTNFAQFELIKLLAAPMNNITVVGDDDQSIYKFRGASVSNILKFKDEFEKSTEVTLLENYRSKQNLLDLAHKFVQLNNPDRLEVKLKISKDLKAARSGEAVIELKHYPDYHLEARAVIEKIIELKNKDQNSTWNDFAILVRANDTADPFVEELELKNVPYLHLSKRGLYRKTVILDLISYFRMLVNYHESRSFFRVLNFPIFNVSHSDLAGILDYTSRKTYSIFESLKRSDLQAKLSDAGKKGIGRLLNYVEAHSQLARTKSLVELLPKVAEDLRLGLNDDEEKQMKDLNLLQQFSKKIQDFSAKGGGRSLVEFMEVLEMELAAGEQGSLEFEADTGPEAVRIITVHSSKGLEFNYVFLPGLADKKFPAIARGEPIELPDKLVKDILPEGNFHLQEERRLFYVAMTRSKDGLYLSFAHDYGGSTIRKPSGFLKEMGFEIDSALSFPKNKEIYVKPAGKVIYTLPRSYSFTTVSTFRKCPFQYKYLHFLKVPEAGSAALSFGKSIHKTLEVYLKHFVQQNEDKQGDLFLHIKNGKKNTLPSLKKMLEFYHQSWIDEWFESKKQEDDYKERGTHILKLVYAQFEKQTPHPKYIEKSFKFSLGQDLFTGKIDRIDFAADGILIIDYKTGSNRPLGKVDKEQLLIYQIAAEDFLQEKVRELQFWYFDGKIEMKKFLGEQKEINETKRGLSETIAQIKDAVLNNRFEHYHNKHQNCDYLDMN